MYPQPVERSARARISTCNLRTTRSKGGEGVEEGEAHLDRHGVSEASLLEHVQHLAAEAALIPVFDGLRDILATDLHELK